MMETIEATVFVEPFPHIIIDNFYNEDELQLIWEELKFFTKPDKLIHPEVFTPKYGGKEIVTNAKALHLNDIFKDDYKSLSNILTVNRKIFQSGILDKFSELHDSCSFVNECNYDITILRYYHNGEYHHLHSDVLFQFLAFSYFYKEPKKFSGGELIFPSFDYSLTCKNNSIIIFPGWVEHEVSKVEIKNSDYYDGWGRYSINTFFRKDESITN